MSSIFAPIVRRPWPAVLAAVLCAAPSGCSVSSSNAADAQGEEPPAKVVVGTVRGGTLQIQPVVLGEVRAQARAELGAGAAGEIREVTVREGDRVAQGDLLARIDPSLAKAALNAAKASTSQGREELDQASRDRRRTDRLGNTVVSEAEVERDRSRAAALEARYQQLRASTRAAKASLARHKIVAPFDGVVASRHVDPGDWVQPGDRVVSVVAADRVEIFVNAPAELVARIQEGDRASVRRGNETADVEIRGLVPALDPLSRTATIRLEPIAPVDWLIPGLAVDVTFTVTRSGDGVIAPRDALVTGAANTRVLRLAGEQVETIIVEVVATSRDEALIKGEGLKAGDQLVVRGNERLRPGQAVVVVEPLQ